ncbi:MAG: hypothetical protein ABL951_02540 [Alphaproteobacteria bacterium]
MAGMLSETMVARLKSAGDTGGVDPNETIFAEPDQGGEGEAATPEEQQKYEQFIDGALKVIYNDKTKKKILDTLAGSEPVEALGGVAAMVASRVTAAAVKAGDRIDPAIVLAALEEIIPDLAEFAQESGARKFTQEEIDGAFIRAVDQYRETETRNGNVDPQEFAADFEEMMRADQAGRLGEVAPALGNPANGVSAPGFDGQMSALAGRPQPGAYE